MSWITKLAETYDNCSNMVGVDDGTGNILLPIAHSTQNAQIEIVLGENGDFRRAERVDKAKAETIIPVTEDSGSRANGITPHPLCDKLIYIAGDYSQYVSDVKNRDYHAYFEAYIEALAKWKKSPYTNLKVNAIYQYLLKENVIHDLIEVERLKLGEDGKLSEQEKINGINQKDAFIRFRVEVVGEYGCEDSTWKDKKLYTDFQNYYTYALQEQSLCYATGEFKYCSDKHPSKIRHSGDKSKLISSNDTAGFTYRGRFATKEEANSVGYEVSQKAHNALKWLLQGQKNRYNEMVLIAWRTQKAQPLDVIGRKSQDAWMFEEDNDTQNSNSVTERSEAAGKIQVDTGELYRRRLRKAIYSGICDIQDDEDIVIMTMEAATTGRLSITYYKEMNGSKYKESILNWHDTCVWKHWYLNFEGKKPPYIGTPSLEDIVLCAYATEREERLYVNDKIKQAAISRLLPCVLDSFVKNIPTDIVEKVIENASRPTCFSNYNRLKITTVACAVIKRYYDMKGEHYQMRMEGRDDRDFLFGQLLALAEMAEQEAIRRSSGGKYVRNTNAERLMNAFRKRPFTTWNIIFGKISPYLKNLGKDGEEYKQEIIKTISEFRTVQLGDMQKSEFEDDSMLNGSYLLGYSVQKMNGKHKGGNES